MQLNLRRKLFVFRAKFILKTARKLPRVSCNSLVKGKYEGPANYRAFYFLSTVSIMVLVVISLNAPVPVQI